MNLIDMDRLRKELMAKGDIPIHEVFNTIWDQPIVNILQPKWIPVSKRLPEKSGYYLITIKIEIPGLKPYYEVSSAKFGCFGNGNDFDIGYIGDDISVIAWMPLPEPYRESEE